MVPAGVVVVAAMRPSGVSLARSMEEDDEEEDADAALAAGLPPATTVMAAFGGAAAAAEADVEQLEPAPAWTVITLPLAAASPPRLDRRPSTKINSNLTLQSNRLNIKRKTILL